MKIKALISGGGTGGHIFPALSIANGIKERCPEAEILFVGAENRMEMEKVPAAGYPIIGLPVSGFDRHNLLRNFAVLFRLYKSMRKAKSILKDFNPDIAIGVGGYASGPMLKEAQKRGIPTLLQEQNSYAGVTNKLTFSLENINLVADQLSLTQENKAWNVSSRLKKYSLPAIRYVRISSTAN